MPKERNYNPVQAQRKADKAKEIKKGKAEIQARRNEKLAQRNPDRVQKQIDDLKALKAGGGKLTQVEEQSLEALEKDLKAIKKARELLGDKAPTFGHGGRGPHGDRNGVLGKRRRDEDAVSSDDSDVPEGVRKIPMPRDTPPPIPKEILDEWYAKRRAKRNTNANNEPLQGNRLAGRQQTEGSAGVAAAPTVEAKTVYEAKPEIRNLRKEAVNAFVPTNVRLKLDKSQGRGSLLEPEEADQLEREGYLKSSTAATQQPAEDGDRPSDFRRLGVTMEDAEDDE